MRMMIIELVVIFNANTTIAQHQSRLRWFRTATKGPDKLKMRCRSHGRLTLHLVVDLGVVVRQHWVLVMQMRILGGSV